MKLVFFTHPTFTGSQSMPRYAKMLSNGMKLRGHNVVVLAPKPKFFLIPVPKFIKKWLGYIDQYILFPVQVCNLIKTYSPDTLFVFADQALGPWVPLVADKPHIIHCHDFLAQRSALGEIKENPISFTGRVYQSFIRKGYTKGKNFISTSKKTKEDLHEFLLSSPLISEIVYNGLNQKFVYQDPIKARINFGNKVNLDLTKGYILHVGGNQWYKNREGVIEIYGAWRQKTNKNLPLIMIGAIPNSKLLKKKQESLFKENIHFLSELEDVYVRLAYSGASIFLFPSLAEGFGWPIAEAMASGCLVITTNKAPMTEVAGNSAFLISSRPYDKIKALSWAFEAAFIVEKVLNLSLSERQNIIEAGLINVERFAPEIALSKIESIYHKVIQDFKNY